jgi:hypothetical protein
VLRPLALALVHGLNTTAHQQRKEKNK